MSFINKIFRKKIRSIETDDENFNDEAMSPVVSSVPVSYIKKHAPKLFTPVGLVAGSRPIGTGKAVEVAYHAVASALENDSVKFIYVEKNGVVHFIGAAAKEFTNAPSDAISSELAFALPKNNKEPEIDVGIIVPCDFGRFAGIVRKGGLFTVYTGSLDSVEEFISASSVTLISEAPTDVGLSNLPLWIGFDSSKTQETKTMANYVIAAFLTWSLLMGGIWVGSGIVASKNAVAMTNYKEKADLAIRHAATELALSGTKSEKVMDEFQKLITLSVQAKGKVNNFSAIDGRIIGWKMELPEYTAAKVYEAMNVEKVEKIDGKLIISKGAF
jgi:hypothetical protein